MSRKTIVWLATAGVVLAGLGWLYARGSAGPDADYRLVEVERGDIRAAVAATGTLSAVTTVEVGTQVSGRIDGLFADFNDEVSKGQLIARIDPTLQEQAVRDAEAGLERARAELEQAELEYRRNLSLYEQKVLTEIEFNTAKYSRAIKASSLKSAQVALDRARQNLAYTAIYAPVDGIVVARNVNVGQTVASSFSAPILFMIAEDLSQMQILASVDESDIGQINKGQPVSFSVQAWPDDTFRGTVEQVRLQSTVTENVVNYTVVVRVSNPDNRLLPGMTASVDFITGEATDVLRVPNAALRIRPTEAMLAGQPPAARGGARSSRVWTVDAEGRVNAIAVEAGITDGQYTEVSGAGLEAGVDVISGIIQSQEAAASSPFSGPGGGRRRF